MRISDWSADVCSSDLPTAELKPDQKDEDSLPPYPVLDDILKGLIEGEESVEIIVARGHDRDLVNRVRSDERRVGKVCVSTFRTRWSPSPTKKKNILLTHL